VSRQIPNGVYRSLVIRGLLTSTHMLTADGREALANSIVLSNQFRRSLLAMPIFHAPPHFPVAAFLRSRAALSFATGEVFSNWAIAPSTCRTRTVVGVSSVRKSGAVAGISEMPSDLRKS
jgi:hypothetical protein